MNDEVRVGVIGMGRWALTVHLPNLRGMTGVRVTALASRSRENLERGAAAAGGTPRLFQDYCDLLASEEVDAVIICAPNDLHQQMAIEALRSGKHVLVEKPLAFTVAGCEEVIKAAQEEGKVLQVGLELRYGAVFGQVKELLEGGTLGELALLSCDLWREWVTKSGWRTDPARTGGVLLELGCHYLDLLTWLADSPVVRITGVGGQRLARDDLDHLYLTFAFANGAKARFEMCLFAPYTQREVTLDVIGTQGRATAHLRAREVVFQSRAQTEYAIYRFSLPPGEELHGYDGSRELLEDFVTCIHTGRTPQANGKVGRRVVALAQACQQALAAGCWEPGETYGEE